MNRRLTGTYGVSDTTTEKPSKPKRTPPKSFVLGALVDAMLDDLARDQGITRAEVVRRLIVRSHASRGL